MYPSFGEGTFSIGALWGDFSFIIAFVAATLMVTKSLRKNNFFWLKLTVCGLIIVAYQLFWLYFKTTSVYEDIIRDRRWISSFTWLFQYLLVFGSILVCYKSNLWIALFCSTLGYSLQHASQRLYAVIGYVFLGSHVEFYQWVIYLSIITAAYYLAWYFISFRKLDYFSFDRLSDNFLQIIISSLFILIVAYLADAIRGFRLADGQDVTRFRVLVMVFSILFSFVISVLEVSLFKDKQHGYENERLHQLLESEKKQYIAEKENIELLNIKYHDLKHFINDISADQNSQAKAEAKAFLDKYDSMIHTGNQAIDTIMTTKALYCSAHDIALSCMVDGNLLSFIKDYELYMLFDNAVTNAISASEKCPKEKRVISITTTRKENFVQLSFSNYFIGNLVFSDGMPQTSKDKDYHGFGTRSIQMLARNYNGEIVIKHDGGVFTLNILLPLSDNISEKYSVT